MQGPDWICCPHVEYQEDHVTPWIPQHGRAFTLSPDDAEVPVILLLCGHCKDLVSAVLVKDLLNELAHEIAQEAVNGIKFRPH